MPELPEVEVIRRFLTPRLTAQTIKGIKVLNPPSFSGQPQKIINQKIQKITRRGKQLSLHLDNRLILLIHLKMTGQLIYLAQTKTILGHPTPNQNHLPLPHRSTRLIFTFSNHSKLFFNDQRKFGWIKLLTPKKLRSHQSHLGPDLLSPKFTLQHLYHCLHKSRRPIKTLLLDQTKFAGIGNIYANEALFLAKIHPLSPANNISLAQAQKLYIHLLTIIRQSIAAGGSTAADNQYLLPNGSPGRHQYSFWVYQRVGEPCLLCQTKIISLKIAGRSAFLCPSCQKP